MTTEIDKPLPESLVDLALVDGPTAARVGGMSVSWWQKEVNAGRAPQPAIRSPRCARWRLVEVRLFWQQFATDSKIDGRVVATARTGYAARAKRSAAVSA